MRLTGKPKRYYQKIKSMSNVNGSVLDVGGGSGLIAQYIVEDANRTVVLDPSKGMLKKIKSDKIERVHGVAQKIPFPNNSFDVVCCVDSFHHFTNGYKKEQYKATTKLCIKELLRVLKKDGALMIVEFDIEKSGGKLAKLFEDKMRWGSNFYSKDQFKALFGKDVKVEIQEIDTICYIAKISKK